MLEPTWAWGTTTRSLLPLMGWFSLTETVAVSMSFRLAETRTLGKTIHFGTSCFGRPFLLMFVDVC
jgi:hypothetical protein